MSFIYLYLTIYSYLDFYYDDTILRYAKLALALVVTPTTLLYLISLVRMGKYSINYILCKTLDEFSFKFITNNYDFHQTILYNTVYKYNKVNLKNFYKTMREDYNLFDTFLQIFVYIFSGCDNGTYEIKKNIWSRYCYIKENYFYYKDDYKKIELLENIEIIENDGWNYSWNKKEFIVNIETIHKDDEFNVFYTIEELQESYTLIKLGNKFFYNIIHKNNPKDIRFKYNTVFCYSNEVSDFLLKKQINNKYILKRRLNENENTNDIIFLRLISWHKPAGYTDNLLG